MASLPFPINASLESERHTLNEVASRVDPDTEILEGLGYRQEFKRKFTVWSNFSVSFSSLGLLPSIAATLAFTLGYEHFETSLTRYAGTGGMVWGWIIAIVMNQFVATSMAELCSSMPTAVFLIFRLVLNEGRALLCLGSPGSPRMGSVGFSRYYLQYLSLTKSGLPDGVTCLAKFLPLPV
jgi:hypothetical protein